MRPLDAVLLKEKLPPYPPSKQRKRGFIVILSHLDGENPKLPFQVLGIFYPTTAAVCFSLYRCLSAQPAKKLKEKPQIESSVFRISEEEEEEGDGNPRESNLHRWILDP